MSVNVTSQPGASGRLPTAPTNVTATAVSGGEGSTGSASVSWTASSNPGRATGTYVVRSYDSSNNPGPTASVSASATSVSVTGLTIGMDYTFKVELQSPYGLTSAQSAATPSSIRAFRRPTIGTSTKGAGTAVAVTSMSHIGKADTWGRTSGTTVASATNGRSVSFAKQSGTGTPTLTQNGNELNITGMAEDSSYVFRATWVNSRASGVRITTSVNPEGKATDVSLSWGYSSNYTTYSAKSSGLSTVAIGSGSSAVSTTWVIEDSSGGDSVNTETLYFRVTATNGSDTARTADDTNTSVATSTYTSDTSSLKTQKYYSFQYNSYGSWIRSTYKDSYHQAPVIQNVVLVGGGAGGGGANDSAGGGGGGGDRNTASDFTPSANLDIYVGGGGAGGGPGGIGGSGGTSSIYDISAGISRGSASGGTGGGYGTDGNFSSGGPSGSGNSGGNGASNTSGGTYFYYLGGGGGGEGGAGGSADTVNVRPGNGGSGSSGVCGGGGGSGQLTPYTTWVYYGGSASSGGGAGGGNGGVDTTSAGSGTANTGGGGGGQAKGTGGSGGSGYVSFTFYGK